MTNINYELVITNLNRVSYCHFGVNGIFYHNNIYFQDLDIMMNANNMETTIIATIARMNPPTRGHLVLIERMMVQAAEKELTQISLILSHSVDKDTNPLNCPTKRDKFLRASITRFQQDLADKYEQMDDKQMAQNIRKINVVIVCMDEKFELEFPKINPKTTPILKALTYIFYRFYNYPRENLTLELIIGEDRDYSSFIGKSLSKFEPPIQYNQVQLKRTDMETYKSLNCDQIAVLNMDTVPFEAMSASFVRKLVKCQYKDQFISVMRKAYLKDDEIDELYELLTDALISNEKKLVFDLENPAKKARNTPKPTKSNVKTSKVNTSIVSGGKYRRRKERVRKYKTQKRHKSK